MLLFSIPVKQQTRGVFHKIIAHKGLCNRNCTSILSQSTSNAAIDMRFRRFSSLQKQDSNKSCPFKILGVPKETQYNDVKKSFFKLAMQYHPDTAKSDSNDNDNEQDPAKIFHEIRTAFESLMEDEDGIAILRPIDEDESDSIWKDNKDFDSWFKEETGHHAPFMFEMDIETMREVAEITDSNEGGGLDRGGMWHLAKMVSQNVKDNDSGNLTGGLLQLDTGEIQEEKPRLSRRRRRRR